MKQNLAKLVTKESVLKAIQKFETENPYLEPSTRYDLEYNGLNYPPKEVVREAARIQGIEIDDSKHTLFGGKPTNLPLEELGFIIISKKGTYFESLIETYINILKTKGEPDEKYKYLAIDTFQENWNIDAHDFFEMFKKSFSKVSNLLYQNSWGFIIKLAEYFPEETRKLFSDLYDERNPIENRIKNFQSQSEILLKPLKVKMNRKNISTQQDERTISVYLSFKYPETYILYKYDYYKNYCNNADASIQDTGDRFVHLNLLADTWIKHNYLDNNNLKIEYRKHYLEPKWNDSRLIIQNILYVCYRFSKIDAELLKILNQFQSQDLVNYYSFLDKIIEEFNLVENDQRIVFNCIDNQIIFTVGQRHAWNLKNNQDKFKAISSNEFSLINEKYDGLPVAFLNKELNFNAISANSNTIFEAIEIELARTKLSGYYKHNNPNFEKLAFDSEFRKHLFSLLNQTITIELINNSIPMKNTPLNQILYGAPGTGKTYTTKKLAIEIIDNQEYDENDRKTIVDRYDELVKSNQIHFTTFHQSISYEDFIEGIKPETNNNQVNYEVKDGIFKKISTLASDNNDSNVVLDFNFEESFIKLKQEWEESENGEVEIKMKNSSFYITKIKDRNIEFRKASGGYGHELVNKTLKELAYNTRVMDSGLAVYYYPLITKLKSFNSQKKKIEHQKYVLIIDEINRGNVSSIFGELITLLEEDKRKGNKEEIEVVLPYSGDKFSVPNNLYIIGTMNTADRSVESLDTALRRRFSFVEMPSKPEKLVGITLDGAEDIDLVQLLDKINQRIELLIDKDHQIGHSFFINLKNLDGLKTTFKNKIIPLLEEYFFGDFGKIGLVLGENFISVKNENNNNSILAKFLVYEEVDFITEKKVYQIKNCDELKTQDFISIYE